MINKAIILGNVGKDPDVREVGTTKVATFSVATSEKYKDQSGTLKEATEWHNVVVWGNLADITEKYVKKGSQIYAEGKIRTRKYESGGVTKYTTEIIAHTIKLVGGRSTSNEKASESATAEALSSSQETYYGDLPF